MSHHAPADRTPKPMDTNAPKSPAARVLTTERLDLRRLVAEDAGFILELFNQPAFLENIGDRGLRTLEDAQRYILDGPVKSYSENGFGIYLVELRGSGTPIGISGLVKRDYLEDFDIGFAFHSDFWAQGYATEAARVSLEDGLQTHRLARILAIAAVHNLGSQRVLEKIGLRFERMIRIPNGEELQLFATRPAEELQSSP